VQRNWEHGCRKVILRGLVAVVDEVAAIDDQKLMSIERGRRGKEKAAMRGMGKAIDGTRMSIDTEIMIETAGVEKDFMLLSSNRSARQTM